MSGDQSPPTSGPLTSWKAIARFFERDVRTVQRWEKDEGLPVRRHLHRRKSSVYAEPDELRAWWSQRNDLRAEAAPTRWAALGAFAGRLPRPGWHAGLAIGAIGLLVMAIAGWMFVGSRRDRRQLPSLQTVTIGGQAPGSVAGPVGDLNADGREDLVVSATTAGPVYIIFGGQRPTGVGAIANLADVVVGGPEHNGLWARQVGDFNDDGIDDLLLRQGLTERESLTANGSSYLLWGRRNWPKRLALPGDADVLLEVPWPTNAGMEGCVFGRGADLNGDGLDDVLLGGVDYGTPERRSAGGVLILFGRRTWPSRLDAISEADVTIDGAESGEALGAACTIGDFDGDGAADLALAALEHTLWNLRGNRGRTYLFRARRPWPRRIDARTDFDLRVDGLPPNVASTGLRLADLTGDGRADLIVTRMRLRDGIVSTGALYLFFGGARRGIVNDDSADVIIEGIGDRTQFAHAVVTLDLDGDGLLDLVVSEPGTGTLYAVYGRREWQRIGTVDDHAGVRLMVGDRGLGASYMGIWNIETSHPSALVLPPDGALSARHSSVAAWIVEPYRRVTLEVRPEHEPNVILHNWVCAVRVFGFSRAAADAIDPTTLRLAGAPPTRFVTADYNGDGFVDVQAYFDTVRMRLAQDARTIGILGRTRAGVPIAGADSVVVAPLGADGPAEEVHPVKR